MRPNRNIRLVHSQDNPLLLRDFARLAVARHLARKLARRHGHLLEPFRAGQMEGYELAFCRYCHVGVSLHLGTAALSASSHLEQDCSGLFESSASGVS